MFKSRYTLILDIKKFREQNFVFDGHFVFNHECYKILDNSKFIGINKIYSYESNTLLDGCVKIKDKYFVQINVSVTYL